MQQKNRTLILGNGFDLDLGLHTSYREFVKSSYWPIDMAMTLQSDLAKKLDHDSLENWFDLEDSICEYARMNDVLSGDGVYSARADINVVSAVSKALLEFISSHESLTPNAQSVAAKVLGAVADNGKFNKILSFNYTNLNSIAKRLGLRHLIYSHVHGSCESGHIILGVADTYSLKSGFESLYKTSNIYYNSSNVRYALQNVEEVVFFGHSLGSQDFHYFEDFFKRQSRDDMEEKDCIRITFITKDAVTQNSLNSQLRKMIGAKMGKFRDNNKVTFIRTQDDNGELQQFLEHLSSTSLDSDRKRANENAERLSSMLY